LAAKVKTEHEAVMAALSKAVKHALNAGAYLAEAKENLKHGQWLPWFAKLAGAPRSFTCSFTDTGRPLRKNYAIQNPAPPANSLE
jgi:hypothetical protein